MTTPNYRRYLSDDVREQIINQIDTLMCELEIEGFVNNMADVYLVAYLAHLQEKHDCRLKGKLEPTWNY